MWPALRLRTAITCSCSINIRTCIRQFMAIRGSPSRSCVLLSFEGSPQSHLIVHFALCFVYHLRELRKVSLRLKALIKTTWGMDIQFHSLLTLTLNGGEGSAARCGRFVPAKWASVTHGRQITSGRCGEEKAFC
jgi:hypothetical protein